MTRKGLQVPATAILQVRADPQCRIRPEKVVRILVMGGTNTADIASSQDPIHCSLAPSTSHFTFAPFSPPTSPSNLPHDLTSSKQGKNTVNDMDKKAQAFLPALPALCHVDRAHFAPCTNCFPIVSTSGGRLQTHYGCNPKFALGQRNSLALAQEGQTCNKHKHAIKVVHPDWRCPSGTASTVAQGRTSVLTELGQCGGLEGRGRMRKRRERGLGAGENR